MVKVGKFTSALMLIVTGALLLIDRVQGTDWLAELLNWWPLVLIALGLEYIIVNAVHRQQAEKVKLSVGTVLLSALLCFLIVGFARGDVWGGFNRFNVYLPFIGDIVSGETGHAFEWQTTVPLSEETTALLIENRYGGVTVRAGSGSEIVVDATVWVDVNSESKAERIAGEAKVTHREGDPLTIVAEPGEYSNFLFTRKTRMNIDITVPADRKLDVEMRLRNGKAEASGLTVGELIAETTNGTAKAADLTGNVSMRSTNGNVEAVRIDGDVRLETTNGKVTAEEISGDVTLKTTNGNVTAAGIAGDLTGKTTNGKWQVNEAAQAVDISTTNGNVSAESRQVGGHWRVQTTNGNVTLFLPEDGDFQVRGTTRGSVSSDLPLTVGDGEISGQIGSGRYSIEVKTRGRLSVRAAGTSGD